jgi:hypothetical protein
LCRRGQCAGFLAERNGRTDARYDLVARRARPPDVPPSNGRLIPARLLNRLRDVRESSLSTEHTGLSGKSDGGGRERQRAVDGDRAEQGRALHEGEGREGRGEAGGPVCDWRPARRAEAVLKNGGVEERRC